MACLFNVSGRSSRSCVEGSVHLKMWLSTREDRGLSEEDDTMNEIKQQEDLFTILSSHHLKQFRVTNKLMNI